MRKLFKITLMLGILSSVWIFTACKKDEKSVEPVNPTPTPTVTTGKLKLSFSNVVDSLALVLGNSYKNALGESYTVTKFNYYISNVSLTKADNSTIEIKNVYRIVKQNDDTSRVITVSEIPVGDYIGVKFMLGIDSASNNSGAHSGGLDFDYASDMFWGWNQGYIFLKLEGSAPTSTLTNSRIEYHIGGYGGVYKTQKTFNLTFVNTTAKISQTTTPEIKLRVNVSELFVNPENISFTTKPQQTTLGAGAKQIADNYSDMISFDKIVNE